jgi:hypothetical protein
VRSRPKRRRRGITNRQARYLAGLCREAGEPYRGNGMSRMQASDEINRLLGFLGRPIHERPVFVAETPAEAVDARRKLGVRSRI